MQVNDLSIAQPHPPKTDVIQKLGLAIAGVGLLILLLASVQVSLQPKALYLTVSIGTIIIGTIIYAARTYMTQPAGIKNNGVWFRSMTNRGALGWMAGIVLTGFYMLLYWFPQYLGHNSEGANTGLVSLFDPLAQFFGAKQASQWFVYGTLYTVAIVSMGIKFLLKYRGNNYQRNRTLVVIVSQLFLAYLIPEILNGLNTEGAYFNKDIKYFWPLNYYFFDSWHLNAMREGGALGMLYLVLGVGMFTLITPFLSYFLGKRWYCSWVCGCGGLAETAGDPYRHLSSKKLSSWRIERWLIHGVLVLVVLMTVAVLYGYFSGNSEFLGLDIYTYFSKPYGFLIGAIFSGIIGVGFYPIMGSRVWCRFGCPLAAYMGLWQRFKSRFRITTNGGQCISCGNCSTYCEQGIDVRWYAQRGQNIVRSSCVGCGICSAVCPRGVLKLENGPEEGRINDNPIQVGNNGIEVKI
ncbi:MAG: 4Fe-4S binding protein [Chitinophagaceae bacterium]|nr:4Fe-4S binding protein [Chitinophagaceae bacterium]